MLFKYLKHFFTAVHSGGHGVHSPYVYNFTTSVVLNKYPFYAFQTIEDLRDLLLRDHTKIDIKDFGTGHDRTIRISEVMRSSVSCVIKAQFLYRIAHFLKARNILELGTSLGISTAYLASPNADSHCVTMEGSEQLAFLAQQHLAKLNIRNVDVVVGNIDDRLTEVLDGFQQLDLIYIDANHQFEAVINYFEMCLQKSNEYTVIVLDDIHWSSGMEKAWRQIKGHNSVYTTIDLFYMGIVFLKKDLHKRHFRMRI